MPTTRGLSSRSSRRGPSPLLLIIAAVSVGAVVAGVWLLLPRGFNTAEVAEPTTTATSEAPAAEATAETRPTQSREPVGFSDAGIGQAERPDAPTRVRMAAVDLDLAVVPVAVREDGQMEVPDAADEVGWYRYGPVPGADAGSAVLAAHVDTQFGPAPMAAILDARAGDIVDITTESGTQLQFTVVSVEQVSKEVLPLDELFARGGDHSIRLVTCGGEWDAAAGAFDDNIVVTAVPVEA